VTASEPSGLYDDLWDTKWSAMQTYGPVHRHMREALLREVAGLAPASVLDVGCGAGDNLAALATAGDYELSGIDVSPVALEKAAQRVPRATFAELDVARERLDKKFDLVFSSQVIEHILDDIAALENIAAMSQRHVYLSTMTGRMRASELAIGHVRNYSPVELRAKAEAAGIRVLRVAKWGFPFYSAFRSLIEVAGGRTGSAASPVGRFVSSALYQLYRLNSSTHGDVLTLVGAVDR
jgi:SAM-dependent methyltransferase